MGSNTQVLGISTDPLPTLHAWAESLAGISYPLLSDFWPHGEVSEQYGILRSEGYPERAIFLIDKDGVLRFQKVYDPGIAPDIFELFDEIYSIDPEAKPTSTAADEVPELPSGGIVMYCTQFCKECREARKWMDENNLEYTEVNVYETKGAAEQVREWTGGYLVTPTFDVDGEIVVDFDLEKLAALVLPSK